jgi:hypothetical protein
MERVAIFIKIAAIVALMTFFLNPVVEKILLVISSH